MFLNRATKLVLRNFKFSQEVSSTLDNRLETHRVFGNMRRVIANLRRVLERMRRLLIDLCRVLIHLRRELIDLRRVIRAGVV